MGVISPHEVPRRFDLKMFACAENVYLIRNLVDQAVDSWGLSENVRHTGRLVLTELTTNAVRLYKEIYVWVSREADRHLLELAVWDPGPTPRILPLTEDGESGRGLALAYELADRRLGWYRLIPGILLTLEQREAVG